MVQVHVEDCGAGSPVYMECAPHLEDETGLCVEDALLQLDASGCAQMVVSNPSSCTQVVERGTTTIGQVMTLQ